MDVRRRSPHGERGLKSLRRKDRPGGVLRSLPSRGAWIEMCKHRSSYVLFGWSLPSRGAWIEIAHGTHRSLP